MNAVVAEGIPCFSGSCSEIYLEKAFVEAGIGPGKRLPFARKAGETRNQRGHILNINYSATDTHKLTKSNFEF